MKNILVIAITQKCYKKLGYDVFLVSIVYIIYMKIHEDWNMNLVRLDTVQILQNKSLASIH